MPTCPPRIAPEPTVELPEIPVCAAITTFSPSFTLWPMCTRLSIFVPGADDGVFQSPAVDGDVGADVDMIADRCSRPTCGIG